PPSPLSLHDALPIFVAVIVAVPAVTPVTRPLLLFTVAADASELHTTVRPVNGLPPASFSVAVSCTVAFVKMLAVAGATVTVATGDRKSTRLNSSHVA